MNDLMLYANIDLTRFQDKLDKARDAILAGAIEGLDYAAKGAAVVARKKIAVTGTYGSKKRFAGEYGKFAGPGIGDGRTDTGDMIFSLGRWVDTFGDRVLASVGWIDAEPYFKYQEEGFDYLHNRYPISGKSHKVRGMFALKDAETILKKTSVGLVSQGISRMIKKFK
jgi:hypothetical protein